ncbi:hypothetical protein Cni_G25096 [Canna indica]|uniref:Tower domain-containing protein n=1 Tax=Canna indica TaxID=4628 RepID=A0AAQ3KX27_9LILI|nr:hypothetical protein Cni_G25096 [Canna indica]
MPKTTELPTWEIRPTADGNFQWTAANAAESGVQFGPPLKTLACGEENQSGTLLPSMADLLTLARTKVLEGADGDGNGGGFPMFRTGTGRSVRLSESSVRKARSVLRGADDTNIGKSIKHDVSTKDYGFPLFSTGSGKSVTVEESSIRKAAAILQGKDMNNSNEAHTNFSTKDDFPLFSTGSGKSVTVKESSIKKATAILEGNNMTNAKATTLLGLEEDKKIYTLGCFEQTRTETSTKISMGGSLHENFSPDKNGYTASTFIVDRPNVRWVQRSPSSFLKTVCATGNHSNNDQLHKTLKHTVDSSYHTHSPVKYHTASGQYNSISNNALTRARRLLGDSDIGVIEDNLMPDHSCLRNKNNHVQTSWNKEKFSSLYSPNCEGKSDQVYRTPPSISKRKEPSSLYCKNKSEGYMLDQENARNFPLGKNYSGKKLYLNQKPVESILAHNAVESRTEDGMPLGRPLVDISNIIAADCMDVSPLSSKKRQSGKMSSFSQFKRPRSSRFVQVLNFVGSSKLSTTQSSCCSKIFNNYPFQLKRMNIKDFFGCSPVGQDLSWSLPPEVRNMDADNALTYRFPDTYDHNEIGTEAFQDMLLQCGASSCNATKEWVANHYRWIVWKFACYERCYPTILRSKLLTVSNVVEELKYRYEREVNHGHRSAIKKILDGDASPATMMVLCVSAIRSTQSQMSKFDDINCSNGGANEVSNSCSTVEKGTCDTIIELTDGWYSLDALPDVCLSKQLVAGKLFVGQKLRIWGAGLCGWAGPISSLEASKTVRLLMHINGTYRAHWDDKLGFCKHLGAPLAFKCIKVAGGKVPRTLVGITRIYPVLYRERFPDGGHIVRSERLEKKALQKYNQRRCNIVEAIMSEQIDVVADMNDSDEGAKLYEILEVAAEPEVLMADMTSEQLFSFSAYQAKQKDVRQMDMQKKIEKALKDAGLVSREVTPFMRVRVVGLTSKHSCRKGGFREGMITIWNPTEEQRVDLVEGKIYDVAGLMPINCSMDVLYLQSSGSSTVWKSLPSWKAEKYEPFFNPRKSVTLSNLAVIPLASEFDIAAIILHVEDSCVSGHQKKQWIFVSDGCNCSSTSQSREQHDCLLAISFSSPIDNDSSALFSHHHEGTVVGFFNLIKRVRDQTNHLWVAEGTENSTHSACYNLPKRCHLKEEATSAQRWAKTSYLTIQKLKERILHILGHRET